MSDLWTIHQGDCIPGMAELDEGSVDLTVTFFTSSAEFSESIYERLTGASAEGHIPCQRVNETFGRLVVRATEPRP